MLRTGLDIVRSLCGELGCAANVPVGNVVAVVGAADGGIAETAVSTSGRTFAVPKAPWQSLIADLVAQGATGCKGYVSEPGASAMARADILFDRYRAGYTVAESFYMASQHIHWKDMVIGDPICARYASE